MVYDVGMMNQKIKFRVWHKGINKYVSPTKSQEVVEGKIEGMIFILSGEGVLESLQDNDSLVYQLGSGIKDKDGIEIYEGDIIRGYTCNDGTEVVSEVLFSPHRGFWIDNDIESWDRRLYDGGIALGSDVEVMGNVFEDAFLIEEYDKRIAMESNDEVLEGELPISSKAENLAWDMEQLAIREEQ